MNKIWLITKTTYRQSVRSGYFLVLTLALPVLMVIAGAVPFLSDGDEGVIPLVGYVDQSELLAPVQEIQLDEALVRFEGFDSLEEAQAAYQRAEISGYMQIPAGYFAGEAIRYFSDKEPSALLTEGLVAFMRQSILPDAPEWALERLEDPADRVFVALSSGEQVSDGLPMILRFVVPLALAIFLGLTLVFTTGQMGIAVVREKDQRAMEILISSLEPSQLIVGKVLGISLVGLTQMAVWGIGAVIGVGLFFADQISLAGISIPWEAVLWAVLLGVPGYLVYAVVASGLGIIAGDSQQAQQLAGIFGIFGVSPLWLIGALLNAPDGATAIGLTLFPLTAPAIALIRMAMTEVPLWQLLASLAILIASLLAATWAVARIFRAAMLMYGQALSPRGILRALRQA